MQLDLKNSFTNAADPSAFMMPSAWFEEKQSVWFKDFTFGPTMFKSADGNVEGLGGVGAGVSDVATDEKIKLELEKQEEDNPAKDASLIVEAGERQRAELQRISVGGVELSLEEWDEIAEALEDPEKQQQLKDALMANGKTAAEAAEIAYLTKMAAKIAQKEGRGLPLTVEERAVKQRLDNDPKDQAAVATGTQTVQALNSQSKNDITRVEHRNAEIGKIQDDNAFQQANLRIVDRIGVAERTVEIRNGMSVASSSDLSNSFEAGFSPASEFNEQARGNAQLAEATPLQTAPTVSGPTLLNG